MCRPYLLRMVICQCKLDRKIFPHDDECSFLGDQKKNGNPQRAEKKLSFRNFHSIHTQFRSIFLSLDFNAGQRHDGFQLKRRLSCFFWWIRFLPLLLLLIRVSSLNKKGFLMTIARARKRSDDLVHTMNGSSAAMLNWKSNYYRPIVRIVKVVRCSRHTKLCVQQTSSSVASAEWKRKVNAVMVIYVAICPPPPPVLVAESSDLNLKRAEDNDEICVTLFFKYSTSFTFSRLSSEGETGKLQLKCLPCFFSVFFFHSCRWLWQFYLSCLLRHYYIFFLNAS